MTVATEYGVMVCPERSVMTLPTRELETSEVKRFPLCEAHDRMLTDGLPRRQERPERGR